MASYLVRATGPGAPSQQQLAWLDKAVRPALTTARKGGVVPPQEQLEFVAELADLNPEYAVGVVILDMLQVGWLTVVDKVSPCRFDCSWGI